MSHVRAVQDAMMDGVETLCLLEDDVVFHPKAGAMLVRLLRELPDDWDQVYLGGQHLKEPEVIPGKSFVWRARNINRTHASSSVAKSSDGSLAPRNRLISEIPPGSPHLERNLE
jgi:GR25 family glycosyltransferase involved in LPS biosynthesis